MITKQFSEAVYIPNPNPNPTDAFVIWLGLIYNRVGCGAISIVLFIAGYQPLPS